MKGEKYFFICEKAATKTITYEGDQVSALGQKVRQTSSEREKVGYCSRERQRERQREKERETERETERQRQRDRDRDRERERQRDRERDRETETERQRETERETVAPCQVLGHVADAPGGECHAHHAHVQIHLEVLPAVVHP